MRLSTGTKLVATLAVSLILYGCAGQPVYRPFRILYDLTVNFADPAWDGKNIPAGQQCPDFGGQGATPALIVQHIPPRANALILVFSNKSHIPLDQGGQGRIGYRFAPGTETLTLPSVPGNTFDLPEPFFETTSPFIAKPHSNQNPTS